MKTTSNQQIKKKIEYSNYSISQMGDNANCLAQKDYQNYNLYHNRVHALADLFDMIPY